MKYLRILLTLTFLSGSALFSDDLKFQLGYWGGTHKTELENRFKRDDLLEGAPDGITRFNQKWKGSNDSFLFPLGVVYTKNFKKWNLVTRGNYFHRSLGNKFIAYDTYLNYTRSKMEGGYSSDYELDFGYLRNVWKEKLFLTGRLGVRSHIKNFGINEITLGNNTMLTLWNGDFQSYSNHLYLGGEILYKFNKKFSLALDFVLPMPTPLELLSYSGDFGSKMNYNLDRVGNYTNRTYIELNDMKSRYSYQLSRIALFGEYSFNEKWSVQFGYREEKADVRYEDFKNRPIRIATGGTFDNFSPTPAPQYLFIEEYLDRQNFKQNYSSSQRGVFLSVSYKMDLGRKKKK